MWYLGSEGSESFHINNNFKYFQGCKIIFSLFLLQNKKQQ